MTIVQSSPQLRFEFRHGDTVTVLEGEELARLTSRFFWHQRRQLKKHAEPMGAFVASAVLAYQGLYGKDVVTESELRDVSTSDARKMDLFYRGMYLILCEALYPDEDWEALLYKKSSFSEFLKEVVLLKPNVFGFGVDINAVMRRVLPRKPRRRGQGSKGA